jgi:hypothetical protein
VEKSSGGTNTATSGPSDVPRLARDKDKQPGISKIKRAESRKPGSLYKNEHGVELVVVPPGLKAGDTFRDERGRLHEIVPSDSDALTGIVRGPGGVLQPKRVTEPTHFTTPRGVTLSVVEPPMPASGSPRSKGPKLSASQKSRGVLSREGRLSEQERTYEGHGASLRRAAPPAVSDLDAWERAAEKVNEDHFARTGQRLTYDQWDGKSHFGKAMNLYKAYLKRPEGDPGRKPKNDIRGS